MNADFKAITSHCHLGERTAVLGHLHSAPGQLQNPHGATSSTAVNMTSNSHAASTSL